MKIPISLPMLLRAPGSNLRTAIWGQNHGIWGRKCRPKKYGEAFYYKRFGYEFDVVLRGPKVFTGYWRDPEATAKAFDEEGYYLIGDAGRQHDAAAPLRPEMALHPRELLGYAILILLDRRGADASRSA